MLFMKAEGTCWPGNIRCPNCSAHVKVFYILNIKNCREACSRFLMLFREGIFPEKVCHGQGDEAAEGFASENDTTPGGELVLTARLDRIYIFQRRFLQEGWQSG